MKSLVFFHDIPKTGENKTIKKCVRVWNFVKTCDTADIAILFETGIFRHICMVYLDVVLTKLIEEKILNFDQAARVFNELHFLLSCCNVSDAMKLCENSNKNKKLFE